MNRIPSLPIFQRAIKFKNKTAIIDYPTNQHFSYSKLLKESQSIVKEITYKKEDLEQSRVSFYLPPSFDYVRTQWSIWGAGGVAVPLSMSHSEHELEYVMTNSKSSMVITAPQYMDQISPIAKKLGIPSITLPPLVSSSAEENDEFHNLDESTTLPIDPSRNAMIIYTSGTTAFPKGVVTTHNNIESQITTLSKAWEWTKDDHILEFLPLHHVHGVINVVGCALWNGAICEMMPKFDAKLVVDRIIKSASQLKSNRISLFMAVPTIYSKLIKYIEDERTSDSDKLEIYRSFQTLRLMVSGSSALPESVMKRWEEISGHRLLERYGMTEIGMCLSNPLNGERIPGTVGFPLPGIQVKVEPLPPLIDSHQPHLAVEEHGTAELSRGTQVGELLVKGPQVFKEYFDNEKATRESFDKDGWFKTGDTVEKDPNGRFKILGRSSVDIIKSGGYKISALEIERELLEHPSIDECAVLGIPNEEYGQIIGAILVCKKGKKEISLSELQEWCRDRLSNYKIPRVILWKDSIPKNAMLKINKKQLVKLFL
eukprot:gene5571-6937_t